MQRLLGSKRRTLILAGLALGTALQVSGQASCGQFAVNLALQPIDFCAIVNCTGGGLFNFCEPFALLADCFAPGTGG